jgi:phosphoserine aminotransferase
MRQVFFTPGPSQLYPTVGQHIQQALKHNIPSISHRSSYFVSMVEELRKNLKILLKVPDSYEIVFLSSGTEAMERIIESCVAYSTFHFIAGAFGRKFFEIAEELGKTAKEHVIDLKSDLGDIEVPDTTELICITHNETSTGWSFPINAISRLKERYPNTLIAVDIVSSAPYIDLDYQNIDCAFFSVQKGFGLPAGLGVLVVSPDAICKSYCLREKNMIIGSYHNLIHLAEGIKKGQTPETPNVLAIYLLNQIVKDMLSKGIDKIRHETEEKSSLLYQFIENSTCFKPFVSNKEYQSKTVLVIKGNNTPAIVQHVANRGFIVGEGYGEYRNSTFRIANFPSHTKALTENLISELSDYCKNYG